MISPLDSAYQFFPCLVMTQLSRIITSTQYFTTSVSFARERLRRIRSFPISVVWMRDMFSNKSFIVVRRGRSKTCPHYKLINIEINKGRIQDPPIIIILKLIPNFCRCRCSFRLLSSGSRSDRHISRKLLVEPSSLLS